MLKQLKILQNSLSSSPWKYLLAIILFQNFIFYFLKEVYWFYLNQSTSVKRKVTIHVTCTVIVSQKCLVKCPPLKLDQIFKISHYISSSIFKKQTFQIIVIIKFQEIWLIFIWWVTNIFLFLLGNSKDEFWLQFNRYFSRSPWNSS